MYCPFARDLIAVAAHYNFTTGDVETTKAELGRRAVFRESEYPCIVADKHTTAVVVAYACGKLFAHAFRRIDDEFAFAALYERSASRLEGRYGHIGCVVKNDRFCRIRRIEFDMHIVRLLPLRDAKRSVAKTYFGGV